MRVWFSVLLPSWFCFFFNDTATTEIYTLSLHDALPICCPHALHPEHALGRTDEPETGYHVRDGYTIESYHALLDSSGLVITTVLGLGSPLLCKLDKFLRKARHNVGDLGSFPIFLLLLPLVRFDYRNPKIDR